MSTIRVRYNKRKGQPGFGTADHVWRVFTDEGKEYIVKHVELHGVVRGARDPNGADWNMVCEGQLVLDRTTSTAYVKPAQG